MKNPHYANRKVVSLSLPYDLYEHLEEVVRDTHHTSKSEFLSLFQKCRTYHYHLSYKTLHLEKGPFKIKIYLEEETAPGESIPGGRLVGIEPENSELAGGGAVPAASGAVATAGGNIVPA